MGDRRRIYLERALALCVALLVSCQPTDEIDSDGRPVETFEYSSYTELEPFMERLDYTQATWEAGNREVPRLYLTNVPSRWRDSTSVEVTVEIKKRLFFRLGVPLALRANELIMQDRRGVESTLPILRSGRELDLEEQEWFRGVALRYGVIEEEDGQPDSLILDELLTRLDVVPVSLVLAQAAEESGWGTSRFAAEGNALFGQWSWADGAIRPQEQREGLGDYGIASFATPLESIVAYTLNLNSHPAYAELRTRRRQMRDNRERISGLELANTLTRYSERGAEYVDTLHAIMRVNRLDALDDAYLGDGPTIHLVPVGPGSE